MNKVSLRGVIKSLDKESCREELLQIYSSDREDALKIVDQRTIDNISKFFSVIANPLRLKILLFLIQKPLPVCLLTNLLSVDQTLVSHHLRTLRECNLVRVEVRGRFRFYRYNEHEAPQEITFLLRSLLELE